MKSKIIRVPTASQYNATAEKEANVIGRKIASARKARGLTLGDICIRLKDNGISITKASVNKWETGETVPNSYQLIAVFCALGMGDALTFLMGDYTPDLDAVGTQKVEDYRKDLIATGLYRPAVDPGDEEAAVEMPVYYVGASAGTGQFLDSEGYEMLSFPRSSVPAGAEFGVRVAGDSMEPVYHNGQIVWVRQCEELRRGQVGIFVYDGESYIKVYSEQTPDEDVIEEFTDSSGCVHPQPVLKSYNQNYDPKPILPYIPFHIIGRVL